MSPVYLPPSLSSPLPASVRLVPPTTDPSSKNQPNQQGQMPQRLSHVSSTERDSSRVTSPRPTLSVRSGVRCPFGFADPPSIPVPSLRIRLSAFVVFVTLLPFPFPFPFLLVSMSARQGLRVRGCREAEVVRCIPYNRSTGWRC